MNNNVDFIKVWPALGMQIRGEYHGPGSSVEIHDQRSLGSIGASPNPEAFLRIDLHIGNEVTRSIVKDGEFKRGVSEKEADEAVAAGTKVAVAAAEAKAAAASEEAEMLGTPDPSGKPKRKGKKADS